MSIYHPLLEDSGRTPFDEAHRKYNERLYKVALKWRRNSADAEDAVQETWLRVYRRYGDCLPPEPEIQIVLFGELRRVLIDMHRTEKRRPVTVSTENLPEDFVPGLSSEDLNPLCAKITVDLLLELLSEKDRKLVIFVYQDGYTQAEAAERLGMTQPEISKRLNRHIIPKLRALASETDNDLVGGER